MANNDLFNNANDSDNQFVISYELLCLLQWLLEYDTGTLKKMIIKALDNGLKEKIQKTESLIDLHMLEDIQQNIVEFFGTLEALLLETINEQVVKKAREQKLMPAIDHIDSTVCDTSTVRSSIQKAACKMEHNSQENPQDLLLKELLRHWKPNKKHPMN